MLPTCMVCNRAQMAKRKKQVNQACHSMGNFWWAVTGSTIKRMVFLGLVQNTALSGLEPRVLGKVENEQLYAQLAAFFAKDEEKPSSQG